MTEKPRFTEDEKIAACRRAKTEGVTAVARSLGVHASQIVRWGQRRGLRPAPVRRDRPRLTEAEKVAAARRATAEGVRSVAHRLGVHPSQVVRWRQRLGISRSVYSAEIKDRAVRVARGKGIAAAAAYFGVPWTTVKRWLSKANT